MLMMLISQQYSPPPSNIFIGGLGYTGSHIAAVIRNAFPTAKISGTVRSIERRDGFLDSSTRPAWLTGDVHVLDLDDKYIGLDSNGLNDLMEADVVIQTVAPIADFDKDPILAFHYEQLRHSNSLQYVAYLSSTGVYGDHNGEWVSEDDQLLCSDAKSLARVQAEMDWGKLEHQRDDSDNVNGRSPPRVDCFRCGGIYGPGRGPLFSSLESLTEAMQSSDEESNAPVKYVNRILVDDISSAILSGVCGNRPMHSGGRAYNLVDDDPAPRMAVVAEARRLLLAARGEEGTNSIPIVSLTASKNTRKRISRGTGNKRCKNTRLKREYGWKPIAPTFREGLAIVSNGLKSVDWVTSMKS
jgi:nucleoside-diphosphate-sugar epimerase